MVRTASLGALPYGLGLAHTHFLSYNPRLGFQEAGAYEKAPTEVGALQSLVARTRFELVISALRGRRPKPLDERAIMAGMEGVEPPLTEPESAVLPLDDIPVASRGNPRADRYTTAQCPEVQGVNFGEFKAR